MIGSGVSSLISAECASGNPRTLRAYSMDANCMPKQIPKKGFFVVRANSVAAIFPSIPRSPKPPGTRIPSAS
ncbi:Uncharacterised protein [Chlamydia trachomatis]|nr:Uncharacterised protein [Chlamydia trachomatis]